MMSTINDKTKQGWDSKRRSQMCQPCRDYCRALGRCAVHVFQGKHHMMTTVVRDS